MAQNEIHQLLNNIGKEEGWSEETKIVNLCGFISNLSNNADIPTDFDPEEQLETYLDDTIRNEKKNDNYCNECCVKYHDTCSMTDDCPCCDETRRSLLDAN